MRIGHRDLVEIEASRIGRLGNKIVHVEDRHSGERGYLKIAITAHQRSSLKREIDVLGWIGGRIRVPSILALDVSSNAAVALLSELPGVGSHEAGSDATLRSCGEVLRMIHNLSLSGIERVGVIQSNPEYTENDLPWSNINEVEFVKYVGVGINEARQFLINFTVSKFEMVFSHGDFCLPNVLMDDVLGPGVIDWDCAAMSSIYLDISSALASIEYNLGSDKNSIFLEGYGLTAVDADALLYFRIKEALKPSAFHKACS